MLMTDAVHINIPGEGATTEPVTTEPTPPGIPTSPPMPVLEKLAATGALRIGSFGELVFNMDVPQSEEDQAIKELRLEGVPYYSVYDGVYYPRDIKERSESGAGAPEELTYAKTLAVEAYWRLREWWD